jgi:integrase
MREGNKLTALKVSRLKEPGRHGDGLGLWLQVSETGTKAWLFRYMRNGRSRQMGLGPLHTVSLAEARVRARQARQLLLDNQDPIEVRRRARDEARAATGDQMLFKDAARRFLELHEPTWKNEKHRWQWGQTLEAHAFPTLGSRPIAAIDGALITEALRPIWQKMPETARRTKQRIERVVQWVKDGMPLPAHGASKPQVRHHPALPFADLPTFMAELRKRDSISARALEFTILTAARTSETIGATWNEINLDEAVWTIPADRMKSPRPHRVPLSREAVVLLRDLPRVRGNKHVFPGTRASLSNMAMLELLRGMRGNGLTVHGFRSTFSDWARERTNYPRDVVEMSLAHAIKDKSEAAYRRGDALPKRRRLMTEWARYCVSPARVSGNVVALHG